MHHVIVTGRCLHHFSAQDLAKNADRLIMKKYIMLLMAALMITVLFSSVGCKQPETTTQIVEVPAEYLDEGHFVMTWDEPGLNPGELGYDSEWDLTTQYDIYLDDLEIKIVHTRWYNKRFELGSTKEYRGHLTPQADRSFKITIDFAECPFGPNPPLPFLNGYIFVNIDTQGRFLDIWNRALPDDKYHLQKFSLDKVAQDQIQKTPIFIDSKTYDSCRQ